MNDYEKWQAMKELEPKIDRWLNKPETQAKIDAELDRGVSSRESFERSNYYDPALPRERLD